VAMPGTMLHMALGCAARVLKEDSEHDRHRMPSPRTGCR
jgi:hypothetical protein